MRVIRTIKTAATVAAILLLAGCILEPQDDSGSISFSVSAPGASISGSDITIGERTIDPGADVTHARVWMYTNGSEYRLAPTSVRAPSSRNYVEADLSSGSATVKIDDIPAGRGYSAVIILGTKEEGDVFVPTAYARTGRFSINAGLETEVRPQKVALVGDDASPLDSVAFRSIGEDLNSVIVSGGGVIAADSDTVYEYGESGSPAESSGFGSINSLSTGTFGTGSVWFVNSSDGIFRDGNTPKISKDGINDVTFSGAFFVTVDATTEDVVFYQRKGGLGGVAGATISSTSAWEDFGSDDLEDLIDPDSSPVRAQASGSDSGFFATGVLDNFRLTEALFDVDSDIEAEDLISGTVEGVDFFNVPYPGTTRPMRIDHMEIVNVGAAEYLVVGTPRGAFTFPQSSIGEQSDSSKFNPSTNVVNSGHEDFYSLIRDEPVMAMTTDENGTWLAVATAETVVVLDVADGIPTSREDAFYILPRRGVALGEVTGLAIQVDAGELKLHISGTQGLTTVAKDLDL